MVWNAIKMRLTVDEVEDLKSRMNHKVNLLVLQFEDEKQERHSDLPWYHSWLEFFLPFLVEEEPDMYQDKNFILAKKLMYMSDRSFRYQKSIQYSETGAFEISQDDYEFIQTALKD